MAPGELVTGRVGSPVFRIGGRAGRRSAAPRESPTRPRGLAAGRPGGRTAKQPRLPAPVRRRSGNTWRPGCRYRRARPRLADAARRLHSQAAAL